MNLSTVQWLRDFSEWHIQNGRFDWQVRIRPASQPCREACQLDSIGSPPPGFMVDEKNKIVYVDVLFEPGMEE